MEDMGVTYKAIAVPRDTAGETRRVARAQPAAEHRGGSVRRGVSGARGGAKGRSGHSRAQPLRLPVPDFRPDASLAPAVVREGDCRGRAVGRRGSRPVPALRRDGEDDDGVRPGQPARALRSSTSRRRTATRCSSASYSAFLGLFVPSAGGKWLIEAPYMLEAAKDAARAPRLGGADLQRHRSARQSHPPLLDAAAARHPRSQSPRHRRLLGAAVRRSTSRSCCSWSGSSTTRCY